MMSLVAISLASCDKKNDNTSSQTVIYGTSTSSALLQRFSLKANEKLLRGLDSVHFTIDHDKKIIYNSDSLPKGTDVTKLLVSLTFGTTVSKTTFVVSGGKRLTDDTTIEYKDTSSDSIDFTGKVTLNITSQDGSNTMSYRVNVNVHTVEPDSILFPITSRRDLPAAGDDNYAVGMTQFNGTFYSLVHNSNGRYMATATTPAGKWSTETSSLPFTPVEKTLTATSDAMYILDDAGNLYTSQDARNWTSTGITWKNILGVYNDQLLGLMAKDGKTYTDQYPANGKAPVVVPADFPVEGSSHLAIETSPWAINPTAIMVGGRDASGNITNATWAYDGETWAQVNRTTNNDMPAIEGATLFSYFTYDLNSKTQHATSKTTWIVMGGKLADGSLNRTTYISRDLGITWLKGSNSMSIATYMPAFTEALAFVCSETVTDAKRIARPVTEWDVPYLYLVGGYDAQGHLLNNVWKGTILRMTFKPIY